MERARSAGHSTFLSQLGGSAARTPYWDVDQLLRIPRPKGPRTSSRS